ncbi:hypothetical protein N7474_007701 [Penicillium riverlandense]|uniref:uncharacterized protein n=1 Tax=Penicillium riverlandense TaxID=1903569 RepID=UPI0025475362|nr:uncharacterized protein N7474_007701 [Penicillium riverlandense]KAJ5811400.1 hypothetical protein N7474_007701 [Penicillium riverlandense]
MLRVAVEGCGHGSLNEIYDEVTRQASLRGWTDVDLVIIGGDFQALRNSYDAVCISVPNRFKKIGDFHEYYSGHRIAPYLTIFAGGNHEAGNYMFELYYGGWVAHNIYYLGAANLIRCGPLRIAGMSGIFKQYDYRKPHFERLPYNQDDIQSIYHIREIDVRKLLQIRTQVDVGLSHDWPRGIEHFGDSEDLFKRKKGFGADSASGRLGSTPARQVLDRLRPAYWFSGHLHVEFGAVMSHCGDPIRKIDPANIPAGEPASWAVEVENKNVKSTVLAAASGSMNDRVGAWNNFSNHAQMSEQEHAQKFFKNTEEELLKSPVSVPHMNATWKKVDSKRQVLATELSPDIFESKKQKVEPNAPVQNSDEIDLDLSSDEETETLKKPTVPVPNMGTDGAFDVTSASPQQETMWHEEQSQEGQQTSPNESSIMADQDSPLAPSVDQDLRSQLPASFARPPPQVKSTQSRKVSVPVEVRNTVTKFLALDKPRNRDHFVRVLELNPISAQSNVQTERPFRLQYDKEWLAITRVFANELELGNPNARTPPEMDEGEYKKRVIEEEQWVEENIVKKGLMNIPANFTRSAPKYDPSVPISTTEAPPEYNNIQTAEFCELVGIENKFYLTEEQRLARVAAGPRPCRERAPTFNQHGGRGGGRGRGRGRGGQHRGAYNSRGRGGGGTEVHHQDVAW